MEVKERSREDSTLLVSFMRIQWDWICSQRTFIRTAATITTRERPLWGASIWSRTGSSTHSQNCCNGASSDGAVPPLFPVIWCTIFRCLFVHLLALHKLGKLVMIYVHSSTDNRITLHISETPTKGRHLGYKICCLKRQTWGLWQMLRFSAPRLSHRCLENTFYYLSNCWKIVDACVALRKTCYLPGVGHASGKKTESYKWCRLVVAVVELKVVDILA